MNNLLSLAEGLLVDRVISNKAPVTGESKAKSILAAFAGFTGVFGLGLILYSTFLWLSANNTQTFALAVMGAILISLSIITCGVIYAIIEYKRKKMQQIRDEIISVAEEALMILQEELSEPVNDNPKSAMMVSTIAGYVAGQKFL